MPSPQHAGSTDTLDPHLRAWLRPWVGEIAVVRTLIGGITSQMLQLRRADGGPDLVLRRWSGERDWEVVRVHREVAGLQALARTNLPIPTLIAADPEGSAAGRPSTVTTFQPGQVELAPTDLRAYVRRLAEMLTRIHAVPPPELDPCEQWAPSEIDWLEADADPDGAASSIDSEDPDGAASSVGADDSVGPLASSELRDKGLAHAARELASRPPDPAGAVLSHGDYQHFNVLWRGGSISAVVDWPTVGLADRGLDVGHCRLNLAVLFSADAAMWFLDDYEELAGVRVDPAAELRRLLNFGPRWNEFIPIQAAGRAPVDGPGMAGRVRETIARTLHRAG